MGLAHNLNLRDLRESLGWGQKELAARLQVSQTLVSLIETGQRPVSTQVRKALSEFLEVPATTLPLREEVHLKDSDYARELADLGYPGFAHLRAGKPGWNPAQLMVMALSSDFLDRRVAEALPWLLLRYPDADWGWALRESKLRDLSNRFGFVVTLALAVAQEKGLDSEDELARLETTVERSRLAKQDTFCNERMTRPERDWLRTHSSPQAERWNLLSDLKPEYLSHAE